MRSVWGNVFWSSTDIPLNLSFKCHALSYRVFFALFYQNGFKLSRVFAGSSVLVQIQMNNDLSPVGHSDHPAPCALCHSFPSPGAGAGDLEDVTICGDCKFLLLEDYGTPLQDDYWTRIRRLHRRRRYTSSESVEDLFPQQFSHVINQAGQNQATVFDHDNLLINADTTLLVHCTSNRATPSVSRRWRRLLSDTESDGFDSLFGESESNLSFSGSRFFHDESDAISVSACEGESDASVDYHTFLENEDYGHPDGATDNETDNDIDPMHAGMYHWNSDDIEEENVDEYIGWEETEAEENTVASEEPGVQHQRLFNALETNVSSDRQHALSPQVDNTSHLRIQEMTRGTFANMFEEHAGQSYTGNPEHYLRAREFEELLEHLIEAENSRRGAPPTAVSFVSNLPHLVISGDSEKLDSLVCAICKDSLPAGAVVNQLPCFHIYHPSCILPWLSARNSCPLCRYELPTDDKDYEDRKHRNTMVLDLQDIQQQDTNEDSFSDETNSAEAVERVNENLVAGSSSRENARRGWVFLAAAAAAPFVGVFLVLCFGNRISERRWRSSRPNFSALDRHPSRCVLSHTPVPRGSGQYRGWRYLF